MENNENIISIVVGTNIWFQHDFILEWAQRSNIILMWEFDDSMMGVYPESKESSSYYRYFIQKYYIEYIDFDNPYPDNEFYPMSDTLRTDPILIQMIKERYPNYGGDIYEHSNLRIINIPTDVDWILVEEEDGYEYIAEKHRTWHR